MDTININRVRFTDPTLKVMGSLIADQALLATLAGQIESAGHRLQEAINELSRLRDLYDAQCSADDPGPEHVYVKLPIKLAKFYGYPIMPGGWLTSDLIELQAACRKVV